MLVRAGHYQPYRGVHLKDFEYYADRQCLVKPRRAQPVDRAFRIHTSSKMVILKQPSILFENYDGLQNPYRIARILTQTTVGLVIIAVYCLQPWGLLLNYRANHKLLQRIAVIVIAANALAACQHSAKPGPASTQHDAVIAHQTTLRCKNAADYEHEVVGEGHCVSFIKHCSDSPDTSQWRPGDKVLSSNPPAGTVIATFLSGRYPNKSGYHAAIFIRQDDSGIWVWDQWLGKAVHRRLIRVRHDDAAAGNTAQDYRVVTVD